MFAEDHTAFLDIEEFADTATLPGGGQVRVIFDAPYADVLGMEASAPTALGRTVDLQGLAHGDALQVRGLAFVVVGVQPDGTGMTRLVLEATP